MVLNHVLRFHRLEILRSSDDHNVQILLLIATISQSLRMVHTRKNQLCAWKNTFEVFSNDEPIVFVLAMASDKTTRYIESIVRDTFDG